MSGEIASEEERLYDTLMIDEEEGSEKSDAKEKNADRKKKNYTKVDCNSMRALHHKVHTLALQHRIALSHFTRRQFLFFTLPQALFTMLSSTLAFVAASDEISPEFMDKYTLTAGFSSALVVFIQGLSAYFDYGSRAVRHETAADDLTEIFTEIDLLYRKLYQRKFNSESYLRFLRNSMNEKYDDNFEKCDDDDDDDEKGNGTDSLETYEGIQSRFQQCEAGNSPIPLRISEAFKGLETTFSAVIYSRQNARYLLRKYGNYECFDIVESQAFDILSVEMLNYPFSPLFLPNPKKLVKKSMGELVRMQSEYENYWESSDRLPMTLE